MSSRTVNVKQVLDEAKLGGYQVLVLLLCFLCILFDGFDLTVIGVMVPKIAEYLQVKPPALAYAMSAGLFGPLFGGMLLGMLADRIGRKKVLVGSALIFGVFTTLCAFITSVPQLALCRFIAGLGLGGAIPAAIAFGTEFAPSRARASITTAMYAGAPLGATLSGLSAVYLLPSAGWQSLFLLGGIVPLVLAVLMLVWLPESLTFMARDPNAQRKVRSIVARIAPDVARDEAAVFVAPEIKHTGVPLKHLFLEKRAFTTVMIWICFFVSYYLLYLLVMWAPTVLKKAGATMPQAALSSALMNFGSAIATVTVGRIMDKARNPYRVVQTGFFLGFASLLAFGYFSTSTFPVIAACSVLLGFFVAGSCSSLVALTALSYPPDITASAVGAAFALGRTGSAVAPLIGGALVALNWSAFQLFGASSLGALFIVAMVGILAVQSAREGTSLRRAA